jgi:hypothetical protein
MKIAISGKGGVGKTTLAALLIKYFQDRGKKVLAVDADPDANLALALGVPDPESIVPLSQMKEVVRERTESEPGKMGGFFKLNPKVDDIPEKYARQLDGIKLIVMGGVKKGGSGCICPESVLLRTLVTHMVLLRDEVVVMDMEAGIEPGTGHRQGGGPAHRGGGAGPSQHRNSHAREEAGRGPGSAQSGGGRQQDPECRGRRIPAAKPARPPHPGIHSL